MPRIARMLIDDETTVYHAWDVEPNSPVILRFVISFKIRIDNSNNLAIHQKVPIPIFDNPKTLKDNMFKF